MKSKFEQVKNLTQEWYSLISGDHHKDRDCHWYISTKWSYGQDPVYIMEHYGYINAHVVEEFQDYESALDALIEKLKFVIEEEKKDILKRGDYEDARY
jgi:hypothetical protein